MGKVVITTPRAEQDLTAIINYLLADWDIQVANDFLNRLDEVQQHISSNPEIFPELQNTNGIRRCVVSKHNTLLFKEYPEAIYILTIFDTRQDPDKLQDIIK